MARVSKKITSLCICRICLSTDKQMKDIFETEASTIATKIMTCSNTEIKIGDGYPSLICIKCYSKLKIAFDFKIECERSSMILKESVATTQLPNSSKGDGNSLWSDSDDHCIRELNVKKTLAEMIPFDDASGGENYMVDDEYPKDNFKELKNVIASHSSDEDIAVKKEDNAFEEIVPLNTIELASKSKRPSKKKKQVGCKICGEMFKSSLSLNHHVITVHSIGLAIDHNSDLDDKSSIRHLSEEKLKYKPFICSVCGKCFSQVSNLARHHRCHTGEKPYQCPICLKLFAQLTNLNIHKHVHETVRNYKCERCPMDFKRPSHLAEHMKTHSAVKEYSCNICEKGFNKSSHLVTHLRVHSGEKPFSCEHCGKSFNDPSNLATHIRIHTGVRPYVCRFCNRGYTQKISMIRHEKYHIKILEQKKSDEMRESESLCGKPSTDNVQTSDNNKLNGLCVNASAQRSNCNQLSNTDILQSIIGIPTKMNCL